MEGRTATIYLRLAKETLLGDFLLYMCHDIRLDLFKDSIPKSWQKNYNIFHCFCSNILSIFSLAALHRVQSEYWFMERNNVNSWENTWVKVRKNSNKNTSSFLNQMVWLIGHNSAQKLSLFHLNIKVSFYFQANAACSWKLMCMTDRSPHRIFSRTLYDQWGIPSESL